MFFFLKDVSEPIHAVTFVFLKTECWQPLRQLLNPNLMHICLLAIHCKLDYELLAIHCLVFIGLFASRLTADRRAARRMHRGSYPGEVDFASKVKMPKRRCDCN